MERKNLESSVTSRINSEKTFEVTFAVETFKASYFLIPSLLVDKCNKYTAIALCIFNKAFEVVISKA